MRSESGQSTVEWVGLVLLVSFLFAAVATLAVRAPVTGIPSAVLDRLLCAVSLGDRCSSTSDLASAYGEEVAEAVRANAPSLAFADGVSWVPSDFRHCIEFECAELAGEGSITRSATGEPVTAFTRVIDCREAGSAHLAAKRSPGADEPDCTGERSENLYIAYWFYYPDSSTFEGVPLLEESGYHRHDWESFQTRIGPDGTVDTRASSHRGHNHRRSAANLASDAGLGPVNEAMEWIGARPASGWGRAGRWVEVSAGSHAGNVAEERTHGSAWVESEEIRLVPLEVVVAAGGDDLPGFSPIVPPWEKALWNDPEAAHTG